jgi:hypothetical protein
MVSDTGRWDTYAWPRKSPARARISSSSSSGSAPISSLAASVAARNQRRQFVLPCGRGGNGEEVEGRELDLEAALELAESAVENGLTMRIRTNISHN